MSLKELKSFIPSYAEDINENLTRVLEGEAALLTPAQIAGVALAAAYAVKNRYVLENVQQLADGVLTTQDTEAVRSAVSLMAMNNIYFRFTELVNDEDYRRMSSKLQMGAIKKYGIQNDWELYTLAVSSVNGCAHCIQAHASKISKTLSKEAVQAVARIAAVIHATAQIAFIEGKT